MSKSRVVFSSAIVLYFIIAFEVLIMISPFAGFFYSVFNPFLLETAKYPATRWLSAFYLPHMVLPQDWFLQFVRVSGSVIFVLATLLPQKSTFGMRHHGWAGSNPPIVPLFKCCLQRELMLIYRL